MLINISCHWSLCPVPFGSLVREGSEAVVSQRAACFHTLLDFSLEERFWCFIVSFVFIEA